MRRSKAVKHRARKSEGGDGPGRDSKNNQYSEKKKRVEETKRPHPPERVKNCREIFDKYAQKTRKDSL